MNDGYMTEEELYEKILDADYEGFVGDFHEYLGMTKKEYRDKIHCRYCKKTRKQREYCEPYNPYCCSSWLMPQEES